MIYAALSCYYGWTYAQIEEMTIPQMMSAMEAIEKRQKALEEDNGAVQQDGLLHFSTRESYMAWRDMR